MTDSATSTSTQDGNQTSGATSAAGDEFKPITSQDDLNRIISERVKRTEAKYSDYKDVKAKAAQLDQLQTANQTEAERAAARLAAVEERAAEAERRAVRFEIASEFSLSPDDAKALEHIPSEDGMRAVAERLAVKAAQTKKNGNHVPREGNTPTPPADDPMRAFARGLFDKAAT